VDCRKVGHEAVSIFDYALKYELTNKDALPATSDLLSNLSQLAVMRARRGLQSSVVGSVVETISVAGPNSPTPKRVPPKTTR
jgi:hypothetical protein